MWTAAIFLLLLAVVSYFYLHRSKRPASTPATATATAGGSTAATAAEKKKKAAKIDITAKHSSAATATGTTATTTAVSSLLIRHLRGHQSGVNSVAMSSEGRHIASVSEDESVRVWVIEKGVSNVNFARHNFPKGAKGTAVAISNDGSSLVAASDDGRTRMVHVFTIEAKKNERGERTALLHPTAAFATPHKNAITRVLILPRSAAVITFAAGTETSMYAFTLTGHALVNSDTKQLVNHDCAVSADGKLLAAATKLADTKVVEVVYSKAVKGGSAGGALERMEVAGSLKGQKRGVKSIAFAATEGVNRCYTGSIDGVLCVHDVGVRYAHKEDPKLLHTISTGLPSVDCLDTTAATADGSFFIVAAAGNTMQFWRAHAKSDAAPTLVHTIPAAHKTFITALRCSHDASAQVVATSGDDRVVTLWRCPQ